MKTLNIRKPSHMFLTILLLLFVFAGAYYFFIYNSVKSTVINTAAVYPDYATEEALFNEADLVVVGSTDQSFEDREHISVNYPTGAIQDFYTKTDFLVKQALKGDVQNDSIIKIGEPISYVQTLSGKSKITRDEYTELQQSSEYLLYLKQNSEGLYFIIAAEMGKYNIDNTDLNESLNEKQQQIKQEIINNNIFDNIDIQ
ncbi:hypothetical protein MKZ07_21555 [Paenibacillus sp. FSL P4-0338]|uniref:hypothetical protein n=1 Tax=unclassified Paenibacillus TaxID=185978 RepID=UPI0003E25766|nr:hypothetical protein [Paenibacillus sp. FSL R7-269]ETT54215.1 hypothetical protein C162_05184 [Paenibacillus sp. FSL R7-269]